MKTAFMGSDSIALPMLRHLVKERPAGVDLQAIFTQPDRKSGRGMKLRANAIKEWARSEDLEVLQPKRCGVEEAAFLKENGFDLVLVMAYGQILPDRILQACPLGILNFHASLLPRLRGASPIHTAVALGLPETGVSLMRIVKKLDAGPVADFERVSIGPLETTAEIYTKLSDACLPLVDRCLPLIARGELTFTGQDEAAVSYCRILEKTDACLDFTKPARELGNRIRSFQPWPGTSFEYNGQEIRILAAKVVEAASPAALPGRVFADAEGNTCIACGEGALRPVSLQRPGGKALDAEAFFRGYSLPEGSCLGSRCMQPLEADKPFPYKKKAKS